MSKSISTYDITTKEIKQLLNHLKGSAKRRGIHFDLSTQDIDDIGIPITCPVLGMPIFFYREKVKDDSISFDRIDSTLGYVKDNIIIISYRANKLKSNATLEEIEKIYKFFSSIVC